MNESIFGKQPPKFIVGEKQIILDYWVTNQFAPEDDNTFLESQLSAERAFIPRLQFWSFIGAIHLYRYSKYGNIFTYEDDQIFSYEDDQIFTYGDGDGEDIGRVRHKFEEIYAYNNTNVTLYRFGDGKPFYDSNGDVVKFRLEVLPEYFDLMDYKDLIILKFSSSAGIDMALSLI